MQTIVREMKLDDIDEVTIFLRDHFYGNEPLMQTPGDHQIDYDDAKRRKYRLSLIAQGTSLVAIEAGRFVGVAFAGVIHPSDLEESWSEANEHKPKLLIEHIDYFLSDLARSARFFERYGVVDALYLSVLAVDATVRRQGLGRCLVTALLDVGRAKRLPLLVTSCTSLYSKRVMDALGMECVRSERYKDYEDEDGNVVIQPPAPHTECTVMAIKL
ncbi:GH11001 [Drosophila grimshawi]|uniref:aralkylamine N-acetyltransferase n=1 Tax=Drosophila grimshawi TaxID=7222 RepID=B4JBR7_DROGR|nr:GH11001 [Drosophila grimshawi]